LLVGGGAMIGAAAVPFIGAPSITAAERGE
jgi:hypothetical protein